MDDSKLIAIPALVKNPPMPTEGFCRGYGNHQSLSSKIAAGAGQLVHVFT
jgi:hypothetical protein